ncbi:MAG: hypothetical protein P0Y53_21390 [Candidatus Pseudobacter hemicellulosilyticus]|uniref:Tetratricopeptide repeat protein n=1 Tax=Candidatus Pseudobacter hemicellulosilyticus TaxID=3121375 RepID=A0AAJ5WN78_9BACT|nr:MAG: hypothetical protein P0Y53_21390 [Pseudobacter sp.]
MEETLDYIDSYFNGTPAAAEKAAFEERVSTDPAFAEAVAFYLSARQTVQAELQEQQRARHQQWYQDLKAAQPRPSVVRRLQPWISIAAAACLLIVLGWQFFFTGTSPQKLADNYIEQSLHTLPVTMGGRADSLQQGLDAFNKQDYARAETIFQALTQQDQPDADAFRYLGIVYLTSSRYDLALQQFNTLSSTPGLHANPGPFYKAITLMKRSTGDDLQQAKALLQMIIDQQLPGHREATNWISQF